VYTLLSLHNTILVQTERDTIEVIAYLKKEDSEKEQELDLLRQEVKNLRVEATREREALMADFSQKITAMEKELQDKEEEVGGHNALYWVLIFLCTCLLKNSIML